MPQCFMGVLIWLPALIVPYFTQQKKVNMFMRLTRVRQLEGLV